MAPAALFGGGRQMIRSVVWRVKSRSARLADARDDFDPCRLLLFALDALVDLFAVDRDMLRSVDSDSDLVPLHPENGHSNVVADHYRLANTPRQNQHCASFPASHSPARFFPFFRCCGPGPIITPDPAAPNRGNP